MGTKVWDMLETGCSVRPEYFGIQFLVFPQQPSQPDPHAHAHPVQHAAGLSLCAPRPRPPSTRPNSASAAATATAAAAATAAATATATAAASNLPSLGAAACSTDTPPGPIHTYTHTRYSQLPVPAAPLFPPSATPAAAAAAAATAASGHPIRRPRATAHFAILPRLCYSRPAASAHAAHASPQRHPGCCSLLPASGGSLRAGGCSRHGGRWVGL